MTLSNFAFELAEHRAEQERDAAIARATAEVSAQGEVHCIRCGDEISAARRAAYPAARRCVECQSDYDSERG